jgi:hypothetical protein
VEEIKSEQRNPDREGGAFRADVAAFGAVEAGVSAVEEAGGGPDVLVKGADNVRPGRFEELRLSSSRK